MTETEIIEILKSRLNPNRLHHSICVAEAAERLAGQYGCREETAKMTGLLHDICKNDNLDIQLQIIKNGGIMLTDVERSSPPLYHAMAGSAYLKTELGITDPDVLNAVRYHTTGRGGMSLLEKVIFVADFISADRDYPDVEVVRTLARQSLEKAMLYALEYTVCDLVNRKKYLHPDTVDAYNEMRKVTEE
ncbi:MAG: bis(5'-nucleosyl)-tetraphosphatase (symmetrical) YqeK [Oscillospiraceae bacterium]|nr:bis(5'-nucleosyl)-tetraphosphatase (symmetrical) YqeK [Oscillospiraceae bacterium]